MAEYKFYVLLHRRIAQVSVASSSLRNQGAGGVLQACRDYFENCIQLDKLIEAIPSEKRFLNFLNWHTDKLKIRLDRKARHFGTARKALNLFFRDVVYNKFISERYLIPRSTVSFRKFAQFMEVPLDKTVVKRLKRDHQERLPLWNGIIHLDSTESKEFQDAATMVAAKKGIPRVHLDLEYYRAAES